MLDLSIFSVTQPRSTLVQILEKLDALGLDLSTKNRHLVAPHLTLAEVDFLLHGKNDNG